MTTLAPMINFYKLSNCLYVVLSSKGVLLSIQGVLLNKIHIEIYAKSEFCVLMSPIHICPHDRAIICALYYV